MKIITMKGGERGVLALDIMASNYSHEVGTAKV